MLLLLAIGWLLAGMLRKRAALQCSDPVGTCYTLSAVPGFTWINSAALVSPGIVRSGRPMAQPRAPGAVHFVLHGPSMLLQIIRAAVLWQAQSGLYV